MKRFLSYTILTHLLALVSVSLIYSQSYNNVAYIYDSDSSNGLAFRSFLNANSYPTSLISISDVSSTNFDSFSLIIIDSRSGNYGNWGTAQEVQIIQNLYKPILGLGRGGLSFYQELGLSISWLHAWTVIDTLCNNHPECIKIFAEDTLLSVFNMPYNINFPQPPNSPIIQLYNNSASNGLYKPSLSDSVLYVGREPVDTLHYSIVAEGELYWLWGFDNSPAHMTQTGEELFINIIYHLINGTVGVNEEKVSEVSSYTLIQNYPNPFNPNTKIKYSIPQASKIVIKVYDVLSNEIETLVNEEKPAGTYELNWNAANLPSGVYFYQLRAGDFIQTRKMILLK